MAFAGLATQQRETTTNDHRSSVPTERNSYLLDISLSVRLTILSFVT